MNALHSWDADVILNDGSIATLRAVRPDDRAKLAAFYTRVSDRSKYLRFFGTHPELTNDDYELWLNTRGYDKVTLVVVEREDIVAVAGYEIVDSLLPARVGDVSFLVQDSHHGKGVGNILLEHLAEIGREGKVERFFAEMLTQNRQMVQVFKRAGYSAQPELADGFITVDFNIAPNASSREVMERRELRAEATSIRRLLNPHSVAAIGDLAVTGLQEFPGEVHVCRDITELPHDVDLVIAEYSGPDVAALMERAAQAGAQGVVIMARSYSPGLSRIETRAAVSAAREQGLRALGPAALGLINTRNKLNASPAPAPRRGTTGLFTQSAGVATLTLSHAIARGCGLSSFIGAGSFADVTGNDVMQFWSLDEDTKVCLLSLDSIGNPRKFFRVLRRLALDKHVVVFLPSRALRSARHYAVEGLAEASPAALDSIIQLTGSMVVTRRDSMYDIAQLLARQPVPSGRTIAVVSNSSGLTEQMQAAAWRFGLKPRPFTVLEDPAVGIARTAEELLQDPSVAMVLCAVVDIAGEVISPTYFELAALAETTDRAPLVASFVGFEVPDLRSGDGPEERGQLPVFDTYADAIEALATILNNEKRRALARPTPVDEIAEGDEDAARSVVNAIIHDAPTGRWATDDETAAILAAYDIKIVPWVGATTLEEARAAGEKFGWDVVLKCTSPIVRGRSELPIVIRNIRSPRDMEAAWRTLTQLSRDLHLGDDPAILEPAVQRMVTSGGSLTVRAIEDPVIGPMVSAGISGLPSDVLDDVSWRVPPLRRTDALTMLSELRASSLLAGFRGAKSPRLTELEDIIMRVSRLGDDIASIVEVELTPVIVGIHRTEVVGARLRVVPLDDHRDPLARSLGEV